MISSEDDGPIDPQWPAWRFSSHSTGKIGKDLAVAVSLTHATEAKVRQFIEADDAIGTLIVAQPEEGASSRSVLSGAHASWLAENLAAHLKFIKGAEAPSAERRVHLFIAAPNGFTFFLGQQVSLIAPLTLYEFDFEGGQNGGYEPSLSIPEVDRK